MVEDTTGGAEQSGGADHGTDGRSQERSRQFTRSAPPSLSRRRLLQTGAAAGAGTFALSGVASADHEDVSPADRDVNGDECAGGDLWTGDAKVIDNEWSTSECSNPPVEQCVFTNGDGSFGWEWSRGHTCQHGNDLPNYPQALMGSKIGGDSSGWGTLPKLVSEIDSWDVELDVDMDLSDGEWNFALEWWMSPGSFGDVTDEIMIVLEDSETHTKGGFIHEGAIEDKYGNRIDLWENQIEGGDGADWDFHIFKYRGDGVPSHIDLRAVLDYLIADPEGHVAAGGGTYDGSKSVSGVEIGNENWDDTDGRTVVNQFNVRVNEDPNQTGIAGVDGSWSEYVPQDEPPSSPTNLTVTGTDESSVSLSWTSASDPDGSVDHYEVAATNAGVSTTTSGTSTTVGGLEADTSYEFAVVAVDDDGNNSLSSSAVTATTDGGTPDGCQEVATVDGRDVCDVDGDGLYRDVTGNGKVGQTDVVEFFEVQHRSDWKRPSMFDFSGNGDVGHGDVVALFEYVATGGV